MGGRTILRWGTALALASLVALGAPSQGSGATAKPPADRIGAGARVVTLQRGPVPGGGPARYSSSNPATITEVRALINALPVAPRPTVCPDDLMVPTVVAFLAAPGAAPFARVSFQLGGCPAATVFRGARAIAPPLGGPTLGSTLSRVTALIVNSRTH